MEKQGGTNPEGALRKTLHSHRCLHLQVKHFCDLMGRALTWCNFLVLATAIICFYEAVRLPGIQSLALGFIALNWAGMWLLWISLLASINSESVKFLKKVERCVANLRGRPERTSWGRELRSVRELRVYMNWSYYFDKQHVVTTIGFIIAQMANMTLTF